MGGTFAPSLFFGAVLGGALGLAVAILLVAGLLDEGAAELVRQVRRVRPSDPQRR